MATRKSLSKTTLARLRDELHAEREELLAQTTQLDAAADVAQWRDSGYDDDHADTGSATFERERAQSLANHARRTLTQIGDALQRMDDGTYGFCERCEKPIEIARLNAIPHATMCVEDKERDEHGR